VIPQPADTSEEVKPADSGGSWQGSASGLDLASDRGLPQRIVRILAQAIIEGRIESGARLSEPEIAQQFGVSRTPVREALYALERDGLVERPPRKGARVATFKAKQVKDIYVCRALIYGRSANLATPLLGDKQLDELEESTEQMVEAVQKGDILAYYHLNIAFHDYLARLNDNAMLLKLMSDMGNITLRLRFMSLTIPGRALYSAHVHRTELMQRFRAHDARGAEKSVHHLIASAGDAVLAHFFNIPSAPVATLIHDW
jgi:DNA-binding GntR family transcriptional regulator